MAITMMETGQSKTATYNGTPTTDISAMTGDVTVFLRVESLTAAKNVVFQIQDSVDAFTGNRVVCEFSFNGAISTGADVVVSQRLYQNKLFRAGTASAVARVAIAAIDAGTTCQYSAWLQT